LPTNKAILHLQVKGFLLENLASDYQMKMVSLMTGDLVLAVADQRSLLALAVADQRSLLALAVAGQRLHLALAVAGQRMLLALAVADQRLLLALAVEKWTNLFT
jgi:hypothetical protein